MNVPLVLATLKRTYGTRTLAGERPDPFRVLVTTILSQRTRGENTRMGSARLFRRYRSPGQIARAPIGVIERLVRPAGLVKAKARNVKAAARAIVERFHGRVPDTLEDLLSLPGVGRKTANCVLVYGFRKAAIPVDIHVHRIAHRLGWVKTATPEATEERLMAITPKRYWIVINELLVRHGREVCLPRRPRCDVCPVERCCAKRW